MGCKKACARKKARKSCGSEGRKAKLSLDLKFWHNPLLLHEEGRKEEVETLDRPVMIIWFEVGCVCSACNFLYIMTRRVLILHQHLVRLKSRVEDGARHLTHIQSSSIKHCFHTHPQFIVNHQLFYSSHTWNSSSTSIPPHFPLPLFWHATWAGRYCVTLPRAAELMLYSILWVHAVLTFTHSGEEEDEEVDEEEEEVGRAAGGGKV